MIRNIFHSVIDHESEPQGRPLDYPTPDKENLLFFIQRNHNTNTVVYELNVGLNGLLNMNEPMKIYWIEYNENNEIVELNFIQNKLAYGYDAQLISNDLIEFKFVSYAKRFFIEKTIDSYQVVTTINNEYAKLTNIYIYAEDLGVFPDVKFIEIYGKHKTTNELVFEKIVI